MKRLGALLATLAFGVGCGAQTWTFGASGAEDATVGDAQSGIVEAGLEGESADAPEGDDARIPESQCSGEDDCARLSLHCLLSDAGPGTCVPCKSNTDCQDPSGFPYCDPGSHRCVQCESAIDCNPGEICLPDPVHSCVASCSPTQACLFRDTFCDPVRDVCLHCGDAGQCLSGQACDPLTGRCGECANDMDCEKRSLRRCDRTRLTARCVECLRNSDCGKGLCSPFGFCQIVLGPRGDQ